MAASSCTQRQLDCCHETKARYSQTCTQLQALQAHSLPAEQYMHTYFRADLGQRSRAAHTRRRPPRPPSRGRRPKLGAGAAGRGGRTAPQLERYTWTRRRAAAWWAVVAFSEQVTSYTSEQVQCLPRAVAAAAGRVQQVALLFKVLLAEGVQCYSQSPLCAEPARTPRQAPKLHGLAGMDGGGLPSGDTPSCAGILCASLGLQGNRGMPY